MEITKRALDAIIENVEPAYKLVRVRNGRYISTFTDSEGTLVYGKQTIEYPIGEVVDAPEGSTGLFVSVSEAGARRLASINRHLIKGKIAILKVYPLGKQVLIRWRDTVVYPAVYADSVADVDPLGDNHVRPEPKSVVFRLDGGLLYAGCRVVAYIYDGHIHISMHWLKSVGYRGKVEVSDKFGDEPYFERKI